MRLKQWTAFVVLGLIWGSSFLWIKLAVQEIGPFTLVALRVSVGLLGLFILLRIRKQSLPRDPRLLAAFLFMGVFNTAIPFVLLAAGQKQVDTSVAAVLSATMPLFTLVAAHLWLKDEKITLPRVVGLLTGFGGVIVLFSRDLAASVVQASFGGQLAVLAAAFCQGLTVTFARRYLRGQHPFVQATMILLFADSVLWLLTPIFESPLRWPVQPVTWWAVAWLGLLSSCLAYILYFYLISTWGATRAALVNYAFPVVGPALGILFLHEVADLRLILGAVLVIASIALVTWRPGIGTTRLPAIASSLDPN